VLFITGYTKNAIVHNAVLDQGVHLISKPFTLDQLARKLSDVLRGQQSRVSPCEIGYASLEPLSFP
jgi:hypothetical protein